MIVVTSIERLVAPGWTQQNLYDTMKLSMTDAGYSVPYDEFISGTDKCVVYEWENSSDPADTYRKTYLLIRVTVAGIIQGIYSAWDKVAHTGTDGNTGGITNPRSNNISDTAASITFKSFDAGSEYKHVSITNLSAIALLGIIAPENKGWFDLKKHCYGFVWSGPLGSGLLTTTRNPFNNGNYTADGIGKATLSVRNRNSDQPDIFRGIYIHTNTNEGVACWTSRDIGYGAFNTETRYSTVPDGAEVFTIVGKVAGGLCFRTT